MSTDQRVTMCLEEHVQTDDYEMIVRFFKLLEDYIRELDIVNHNDDVIKIIKKIHLDLFHDLLDDSSDVLRVLTHFTIDWS